MKPTFLRIGLCCSLLLPSAHASIPVDASPFDYSQDFNTLPTTSGASSVDAAWSKNGTLSGWSIYAGESQTADIVWLRVGNGGSGSDRSHMSYGTAGSGERAFGFQSGSEHRHSPSHGSGSISDSTPSALVDAGSQVFGSIVASFINNSGSALNAFRFSYTGEQWRVSANRTNTLHVQWAVGAPSAQPGDLTWNDIGPEQTNPAGANFISPITSATASALDGNASANRTENLGASIEHIVWNPGQALFLRWVDVNDPGSDHGLAIDDFVFNASFETADPNDFRGTYFENFDSLGTTGTSLPAGWSVYNGASGTDKGSWLAEINPAQVAAMVKRSDALVAATPPSGSQNRGFNAALAADPDNRLIGSSPTGDAGTAFQLELTNSGDEQIHAVSVSYDIRRFTAPSTVEVMPGYQLFQSLDNGSSWTNVESLNPTRSGPEGVIVPNTTGLTEVPPTSFSLSSIWAPGAKLLLRWIDDNGDPSPDQVIGLDNVSVSKADLPYTGPVVPVGSVWKYLDDGADPGNGWHGISFDDSTWQSGNAELGYGDGDEATVLSYGPAAGNKYPAYFFRHSFDVADADSYKDLVVRLKRDDGAVVYLNGVEILRDNMPDGEITHLTWAAGTVDGANERTFFEFTIPATALADGENVLAASVHQDRPSSSDISFDLELSLIEKPNPDAPVFDSDIILAVGGYLNGAYTGTLANVVTDANGDPLFFTKVSGPDWLVIGEDGTLSGTPGAGDLGLNEFVVSVTDNKDGTATAIIRIEVQDFPELARAPFPGGDQSLTFGIVPDTQGSTNGVPTAEAQAVTARLLQHAPKFAIHVGDVTDGYHNGNAAGKLVELNYLNSLMTTPLANAGIPLYPVRGNHDVDVHLHTGGRSAWEAAFPYLFSGDLAVIDPANVPNGSPSSPNPNNFSFVLNAGHNTFLVGLDTWQGGGSGATNYAAWVDAQFAAIRAEHPDAHIFAYSHSGLYASANHQPMAYAASGSGFARPEPYIAAGIRHGIDGWFSGHNHIFDRSIVADAANGDLPAFFNMTVGSASNKFYAHQRSPIPSQHLNKLIDSTQIAGRPITYQMVNVNGSFVTISTWGSPKNSSNGFSDWSVIDEYTYSTNGRQFTVAAGANYNSRNIAHTSPLGDTTVRIIDGVNGDTTPYTTTGGDSILPYRNVSVGWWSKDDWHDPEETVIVSDIVSLHGMRDTSGRHRTEPYTLVIGHDAAALSAHPERFSLVAFLDEDTSDADPGDWINAASATLGVPASGPLLRAPSADEAVGNWGIDTASGSIWARLDYQGDFAIASAPTDPGDLPEIIADHRTFGDLTIPSNTTVTVTSDGTLEVTGSLQLAEGAVLVVEGGSLVLGDGSRISGTFTIFNSFGSWSINGDTTFEINRSLALISDIHVAAGAVLSIESGELVLDGCVIDSQTSGEAYRIAVAAEGLLTIARSVVSDANIDIDTRSALVPANLQSAIYDSSFTNSVIEASVASAVYHNLFDASTNASSNQDATSAFAAVDGWSNVTDARELQNCFGLHFAAPADPTRTLDADGNLFVQPGDEVSVGLRVSHLGIHTITAAEALIGYHSNLLAVKSPASAGNATVAAYGWRVIRNEGGVDGALGHADSALGLELSGSGNDGTSADATIANVVFEALNPGVSAGFFRVQTNREFDGTGRLLKDTRLTKSESGIPSYLAPFTSNSGELVIDNEAPEIDLLSVTATQEQDTMGTVDVLDASNRVFRTAAPVVLVFSASDSGPSGLDAADWENDLSLTAGNGATTLDRMHYTVDTVESAGTVTYTVTLQVPSTATAGTYDIVASLLDRSGNSSGATTLGQFEIGHEILASVELQAFTGGSREVTFIATGGASKIWTKTVSFTGNTGSVTLEDVPAGTTAISAKTAWSLRRKVPVAWNPAGAGSAVLTGANHLKAGDLNGDNVVNALDYSILHYHWTTTQPVADITGDGIVGSADYIPLSLNFYTVGDSE